MSIPQVTPEEAARMLEEGALMIDVREAMEVQRARIPGTRHIPMNDVPGHLEDLPRDRPLILQCHSGARSHSVAAWLQGQGLDDVHNLAGGIMAWHAAGLDIES